LWPDKDVEAGTHVKPSWEHGDQILGVQAVAEVEPSSDFPSVEQLSMRVCMVAHTFYEADNRVRRYAECLAQRGDLVDVVALRRENQPRTETLHGVNVFRIQRRVVDEKGKFTHLSRLFLFFLRSMIFLTREQIKDRYDLIHVHSVPDFEVFATLIPKLMGAKVILDIHDIVPEFYASKFNSSQDSLTFKLLVGVEQASAAFSDHVIAANHIWGRRLQERSVKNSKCTTILNYPDTEIFHHRGRTRKDDKFIMLYPGSLNYHQGVDIAIRAFSIIEHEVPEAEFHIYGVGDQVDFLKTLIAELRLQDKVLLKGPVSLDQISSVIENADLGVVPKRKTSFGNEAFSTKILEFMVLGVPVIVPSTMVDQYYFNDSVVKFFHGNDEKSLADAMLLLIKNPELRQKLIRNANKFVAKYTWNENKNAYLDLVDALVNPSNGQSPH
jgi:glycosyltransferase involved in cell wall biosynthesis